MLFGMRASSSASTVTSQHSPSHSSPVTDSALWLVSSSTVSSAAWLSSAADRRPFSLSRAIHVSHPAAGDQLLEQRILGLLDLLLAQLAALAHRLELEQR